MKLWLEAIWLTFLKFLITVGEALIVALLTMLIATAFGLVIGLIGWGIHSFFGWEGIVFVMYALMAALIGWFLFLCGREIFRAVKRAKEQLEREDGV